MICCKNVVKIVCTYHFLKKKKSGMDLCNGIAEIGGEILFFFPVIFAMPLPHSTFFFFFKEMICSHNFYNIFTTNFKWRVVIVELKK